MNSEIIFKDANRIIKRISKIIDAQEIEFGKHGLQPQKITDVQNGVVFHKGIYINLSSIEHKILMDGYPKGFLSTYHNLFKLIYKNKKNPITQFSLRTIAEMGFKKCQILFSEKVSKEEKQRYTLLLMLADYGSMAYNNQSYQKEYSKLLEEFKSLLTEKQIEIFNDLITSAKKQDFKTHNKLTKKARQMIDPLQDTLYRKTDILPFFSSENIEAIFSGFSHILHGNVFLLIDILGGKRPTQHKLRVYWFLLLSGINVINYANYFLKNSKIEKRTARLNEEFEKIALNIKTYWENV